VGAADAAGRVALAAGAIRSARLISVGIAVGIGLAMIWANGTSWGLEDWRTYLMAAERVSEGGAIYEWSAGPEYLYRYAPWFAYALVPFLWLPPGVADAAWSVLVGIACLLAVWPLLRHRTWASLGLAVLMAGLLVRVASTGNVHPVIIAALVMGLRTRAGPAIVAAAASLKAVPILFVAAYIAERRWRAVAITLGLTALLVAPMAWLDYRIAPGPSESLFGPSPLLWGCAAFVSLGALAALSLQRSRLVPLTAGIAAYLALPRSFMYDLSLILPAVAIPRQPTERMGDHSGDAAANHGSQDAIGQAADRP
jgi:hypothetical protein